MKNIILLLALPLCCLSQDVNIGSWKNYLSYSSASYIAEAENKIYCVADSGLFFIRKEDNSINRISKVTGLSDVDVKQVAYCYNSKATIITYANCNIDIIKNEIIINISDIKRQDIIGKNITNITIKDKVAYLSCTFGLVLIDLEKEEVKDTYNIGDAAGMYKINGCAFIGDSIIVATPQGLFYANSNSQNLSDYSNWAFLSQHTNEETYDNIIYGNNILNGDFSDQITSISYNNSLIKTELTKITITENTGIQKVLTHEKFEEVKYAWLDNEDYLWVADGINGLLKFINDEYHESYLPEGPKDNKLFAVNFINDRLYVCHGGHINFGSTNNKNGASVMNQFDSWRNYDYYELENSKDIVEVSGKGNKVYFASFYNGIIELENNEVVKKYSWWNTNNVLDTIPWWSSDNWMPIADVKFDNSGNMWGLLSSVENPLFVKTKDNEWINFSISSSQTFLFDEILIDDFNQKWGIMGRGKGMFVYNDNNTITNINDDQYQLIDNLPGSGNLPTKWVNCFANDLNGEIWVGTDQGVAIFYNPESVFSGYNFDAEKILITDGDYGQYLLNDEKIKCIAIDGANRKWIGTEKSGVFLLSEDGQEAILHFTTKNSPLFHDEIVDITINHQNGEVFIGTSKGLLSYRSDATEGVENQEKTHVFPNPVKEDYNGPIAINGLTTGANVKITDSSGNLVFETTANGGQAIWYGKNKNGKRAATGIYLVFSTDLYGEEKAVSKILLIH